MKAAVVHDFTRPLAVEDRPIPEPQAHQVLVRIEASGLCHTDIHAARGDWPVQPALPFVPGHEGVGTVAALGADVTGAAVGDRVALPWLGYACGACSYCASGWETLCTRQVNTGYSVDGSYAEYAVGDARFVGKVPASVDPFEAAPLTCAGVTTYKAVKVSGARSTDLVAVFGIGGLGHMAVQYAKIAGATVVAVDVTEDKLLLAKQLGADFVVNAAEDDPAEEIARLGGADVALGLAVSNRSLEQAFASLRRNGTLVLVALPAHGEMRVPVFDTVLSGKRIIGSIVGTRVDLEEVFELHAAGRTTVRYEKRRLDDVNDCFEEVLAGSIPARLVFEL